MSEYTPINLGDILTQAGQIKAQQQRSQMGALQLSEAQRTQQDQQGIDSALVSNPNADLPTLIKAGGGMAGVKASTDVGAARTADLTNHYRQTYTAASQVANSDNPLATIQQVAPQFPQQYDSVHGQGAFAKLSQDPNAVKQQAAQVAQDALSGLVDPDKQFQAHQTMIENHYKQEGPGGELARNQNTIAGENARAATANALTVRGQNITARGQNLADARDLKPVANPDGSVTYATATNAIGQPVGSVASSGGGRLQTMFGRVSSAGNEVAQALHNISRLPQGSSSGLLGIGSSPGHGFLATTKAALGNALSSQDTQRYNTMVSGIQRNLASIEAAGLNPGEALTSAMTSVVLKPGDTEMTKLTKMAEVRQIAEKGLEPYLENPGIPKPQKDMVQRIIGQLQKAVPYTQDDITDLMQSKDPQATIGDIATRNKVGASQGAAPQGEPASVPTASGPNGQKLYLRNGQWSPQ